MNSLQIATAAAFAGLTMYSLPNASEVFAQAQTTVAAGPTFDVASVKPNTTGNVQAGIFPFTRGFEARNVNLRLILRAAYGQLVDGQLRQLQHAQIVGGPSWINTDRFDIVATAPAGPRPTRDTLLMLQALLADRFNLAVHRETRQLPIYALVLSRRDGRLSAGLRPTDNDCGRSGAAREPSRAVCGVRGSLGRLTGKAPIRALADRLVQFLDRPVVDQTNLTGYFEIDLRWTPTPEQVRRQSAGTTDRADDPNVPTLFTALQEQLGVKLEARRGPVDVLVIDRVEKPAPD